MQLTVQIHDEGQWRDAFRLNFREPEQGFLGPCSYAYERDYIIPLADLEARMQAWGVL